ncbi:MULTISPECIES: sulfurtransferase [Burkholderiaceae]|uniref:sulfurtransferase n=1 Tax=Burkholderiaceae TaxID=119060 RepID=UPI0009590F07|nr:MULTISPECIES: sulfurtransferase [Burkholderiaceae]MCG1038729.1 sulfurtransferase [Mycetohabitans sp. B7]SIT82157.1 thiosulfate/3-mercaptopyruvate sulfurtransferase [Burkholderia sp. b14]
MPQHRYTTLISTENLATRLAKPSVTTLIFDCRFDLADTSAGAAAYDAAHIPGAQYLDIDRDLSGLKTGTNGRHPLPERETLARRLAQRGLSRGVQVVAYDAQGGMFAARLWWLLRWLGHEEVALLDGGLQAWQAAGQPLDNAIPAITPGTFTPSQPLSISIDVHGVQQQMNAAACRMLDARAPDRYRGENETIDPVAGHIPGARHRFFKDNLAADGRFKPAHTLRDELCSLLDDTAPEHTILYCGSGVTACHNVLAMEIAGLHGAVLYAGSWSEWVADPARPVATGAQP